MADSPAPSSGGEDKFGFLVRKIGPLPVWAWGLIAVGVYYWYTHYGPGASTAATSSAGSGDNVTETSTTTTGPTTVNQTTTPVPSPGPAAIHVPNVVGLPQSAAYAEIAAAGLRPQGTQETEHMVYTVDSESPAAGTQVTKGSTVTLHSSVHGKPKRTVKPPNHTPPKKG